MHSVWRTNDSIFASQEEDAAFGNFNIDDDAHNDEEETVFDWSDEKKQWQTGASDATGCNTFVEYSIRWGLAP